MERLRHGLNQALKIMAAFVIFSLGMAGLGRSVYYAGRYFEASSWQQAEAVIESWHVESVRGSARAANQTDYYGYPAYVYSYQGNHYMGYAIGLVDDRPSSKEQSARNSLARYPIGEKVTVYVNPDNPYDAVLNVERGPKITTLLWNAAVVCMLASLLILPFIFVESKPVATAVFVLCSALTFWSLTRYQGVSTAENYPANAVGDPVETIAKQVADSRARWKRYEKGDLVEDPATLFKELGGDEAQYPDPEGADATFLTAPLENPRWERSPVLSLTRSPEGWRVHKILAPYYR